LETRGPRDEPGPQRTTGCIGDDVIEAARHEARVRKDDD
jgi:hypothetical protein